jgi:hypothetical protein
VRLSPSVQKEFLKDDVLFEDYYGSRDDDETSKRAISIRELKTIIADDYQRDLSGAPWKKDDAVLVKAAGACINCEKRTGANPDLHPDAKGKDLCLDVNCFGEKRKAFVQIQLNTAKAEASENAQYKNLKDVKKFKLDQALRISTQDEYSTDLEKSERVGVYFKGSNYSPTYAVLKKDDECVYARPAVIVEGPEAGHARTVCVEHSCKTHFKSNPYGDHGSAYSNSSYAKVKPGLAERKRERAKKLKTEAKTETAIETLRAIQSLAPAVLTIADLRLLAGTVYDRASSDRKRELIKFLGLSVDDKHDRDEAMEKHLDGLTSAQQFHGFLFMFFAAGEELGFDHGQYWTGEGQEVTEALVKRCMINVSAIQERVEKETEAEIERLNAADEVREAKASEKAKKEKAAQKRRKLKRPLLRKLLQKPSPPRRSLRKSPLRNWPRRKP